jgi:hypothetical protein
MIMSWFRQLIILISLGPFITTNANELTMFANQPLRNGHPTLHIAITPNAPLDAMDASYQVSVHLAEAYLSVIQFIAKVTVFC